MRVLIATAARSSRGHVTRCLAAAVEMRQRSHEVLFACAPEGHALAVAAGLTVAALPELEPLPPVAHPLSTEERLDRIRRRIASPEFVGTALAAERRILREFRPDVAVADLRLTAPVAARLEGVPAITLQNMSVFAYPLRPVLPLVGETLRQLGVDADTVDNLLGDAVAVPDFPAFAGDIEMPAELRHLAREIHHVGPLVRWRPDDRPDRLALRTKHGFDELPVVLVTVGGTRQAAERVPAIIDALWPLPAHLVLVVSGPDAPPAPPDRPRRGRLHVQPWTDVIVDWMKMADVVVIHGGHGTMLDALLCGTPAAVVPWTREQQANGDRFRRLGTGRVVAPDRVRETLASEVAALLGDSDVAARGRRWAETFGAAPPGTLVLAELTERVASR